MKAIGKGSLASFIAVALHFFRVVLWIGFAVASIALLALPLIPFFVKVAVDAGASIQGHVSFDASDILEVASYFVSFGAMLYVVERLLEILKTLRFGSPFVRENAVRFRRTGYALLIAEGSKLVFNILGAAFDADIDGGLELISIAAICAVFVLAEVFAEGARMKEEQDLTV